MFCSTKMYNMVTNKFTPLHDMLICHKRLFVMYAVYIYTHINQKIPFEGSDDHSACDFKPWHSCSMIGVTQSKLTTRKPEMSRIVYDRQISAQGTQKIVMDDKYSSLTSACFAVVPLVCRKLRIIMSWNCGFENQIDTKQVNLQFGGMSLTLMLDNCVQ